MADSKLTALPANTAPISTDLLYMVEDPLGTPVSQKATFANAITKAHGLSDGTVEIASSVMTVVATPTGTGSYVKANTPTLVTPTIGVATATSINKVAITAPATSATLTIANGKTLTASNTITLTGTDSASVAFGSGGTVAYTSNNLGVFASTTSAQLAGVISDETGTGVLVFGTAPTLGGVVTIDTLRTSGSSGIALQNSGGTAVLTVGSAASTNSTFSGAVNFGGAASPSSNDGAALGSASVSWSDLFLASGGLINFANGNSVITHSSGVLNVTTGDLRVTNVGTDSASVATVGGAQTLTNKTLTAPRIANAGFIADANGNEQIIFTTTASAVNELTFANAAASSSPTISATGGDSNVGLNIQTKGTGTFNIRGNSTQAGELRIYEDTDDGSNYTGFKVGTQSGDLTYTLPTSSGTNGQVLSTNGSGTLSWVTAGGSSGVSNVAFTNSPSLTYTTSTTSIGASGDFDVYTCPAGKRAILYVNVFNNGAGVTRNAYGQIKISSTYYQLAAPQTVANNGSSPVFPNIILEAGEIFAINADGGSLEVSVSAVEFDDTAAMKTVKLTSLSSGDNTVYTCPVGKKAFVLDGSFQTASNGLFRYFNSTGGTRTLNLFKVPSGGSTGGTTKVLNSLSVSTGAASTPAISSRCFSAGDYYVVNTDASTAGQVAWLNIIEI